MNLKYIKKERDEMASSEKTQNLQLNKWLGNDSPKREDFNYDNERIDQAIKQTSEKIGILSELETSRKDSLVGAINEVKSSSDAKNVSLESPNFTSDNVQDGMNELFTNVSNGKTSIASAITDMGQSATGSDTFIQLSNRIKDISKDANAAVSDVLSNKTFYQGGAKRTGTLSNRGNVIYTPNDSIQTGEAGYYSGITVNPRPNLTGNATTAQVLNGQTFYSNSYTKQTGVMPNRGTVNQTITAQNGLYTIPQGYHSGSGKVAATFNNLTAGNVKKGVNIGGVVGTYTGYTDITTLNWEEVGSYDQRVSGDPNIIDFIPNSGIYVGRFYDGDNGGYRGSSRKIFNYTPSTHTYRIRMEHVEGSSQQIRLTFYFKSSYSDHYNANGATYASTHFGQWIYFYSHQQLDRGQSEMWFPNTYNSSTIKVIVQRALRP